MGDVVEQAKAVLARRHEHPGPAYRDPVPTGVVELGDWASEHLPDLLAEVERLRPRRIDTVEELDALPDGSVIRANICDIGEVHVKSSDHHLADLYGPWFPTGYEVPCPSDEIALPALLLPTPEAHQ